jgi:hypothetical protein
MVSVLLHKLGLIEGGRLVCQSQNNKAWTTNAADAADAADAEGAARYQRRQRRRRAVKSNKWAPPAPVSVVKQPISSRSTSRLPARSPGV